MIFKKWKPYGITSVEYLKQFKRSNGIERATCVGRLDPLAQGIIHILTDTDTKKAKEYMKLDKTYKFDLVLGVETESHDCLSKVLQIYTVNTLETDNTVDSFDNEEDSYKDIIREKLKIFIDGYVTQKFPLVSSFSIKYDGIKNPLWWFYKNGYRNIQLPKRSIQVFDYKIHDIKKIQFDNLVERFKSRILEVTNEKTKNDTHSDDIYNDWDVLSKCVCSEHIIISLEMNVSSGFYIRRFCHDFGKFLNECAIALDITRTATD